MTRVYPEFPSNCFISGDYSGEQEAATQYLGIGNTITVNPTVKLTASFDDSTGVELFFEWWHADVIDGANTFLVETTLLGKSSTYGLKAISSVVHKENDDGTQKISFSAEIIFDSDTVDNEVPTGIPLEVSVEQDSSDNFIVIKGIDIENDILDYAVVTEPEFGVLTGSAPNLLYTPDESYTGPDSFTFVVSDVFNTSDETTVTIDVGEITVATAEFEYVVTDEFLVTGNCHYSFLEGIINRGDGSYIMPPAIFDQGYFVSRASTATYVEDNVLLYAAINEERKEDGVPLLEQESRNLLLQSNNFTVTWSTGANLQDNGSVLSPDGTVNARLFTSLGGGNVYKSQPLTPTVQTTYVYSMWMRSPDPSLLTSGQAITIRQDGVLVGSVLATEITDGWARYNISIDVEDSTSALYFYIGYDWSAGGQIEFFGAQVEADSILSSYIPTTTSQVTREMDRLTTQSFDSRSTTGTFTSGGKVYNAAINEARVGDYTLLIEKASTNRILRSGALGGTSWSDAAGVSIALNNTTAPDGTTTATKVTRTSSSASNTYQTAIYNDNTPLTASVYAKAGTSGYARILFWDAIDGSHTYLIMDTNTGEMTGFKGDSYNIEELDDGWYRLEVTGSPRYGTGNSVHFYAPTIVGETNYYWGLQVEEAESASSYIPTVASQVTRAKDNISYTVTIWSDDHTIDTRTDVVKSLRVVNWGERLDYTNFTKGFTNIEAFSVAGAIGACKGTIFNGMFWGFPLYVPVFDTSNGVWFQDMFREAIATATPVIKVSNGIYFQRMYKDSGIVHIQKLDTYKGQYFQEMFMGSSLVCMEGIDTRNKINTTSMFIDTPNLINPTVGDQTFILQGFGNSGTDADAWINDSGTVCSMTVDIAETASGSCTISTIGGTCTANSYYEVTYTGNASSPTFQWTVTNGTIIGSSTGTTLQVQTTGGANRSFYVGCTVTDINGSIYSGTSIYTHTTSTTYLEIYLPKRYSQINLATEIANSSNPSATEVYIYNTVVNCSVTTGDLTGKNVEFKNTGELQGFAQTSVTNAVYTTNNGLNLTSYIKVINYGYIRGCGGHGGAGGKGANDTDTSTSVSTHGDNWYAWNGTDPLNTWTWRSTDNINPSRYLIAWEGTITEYITTNSNYKGPYTISGLSGTFTRGLFRIAAAGKWFYAITRTIVTTISRTGGAGGGGGYGASYGQSAVYSDSWRNGDVGLPSSPTGGNSGGTGGAGGWWGNTGYTGATGAGGGTVGTAGNTAGKSIYLTRYLKTGSITGGLSGSTAW